MATIKSGIAITIKAWLPVGETIDDQITNLQLVKDAHESGDYSAFLAVASIDEVKSEQKNRRVEDETPAVETEDLSDVGETPFDQDDASEPEQEAEPGDYNPESEEVQLAD